MSITCSPRLSLRGSAALGVLSVCLALSSLQPAGGMWWNETHPDSLRELLHRCQEQSKDDSNVSPTVRAFCSLSPANVRAAELGARTAIALCRHFMKNKSWNCTTSDWSGFLAKLHKEASFVRTLISSAMAHRLASECARNRLNSSLCPCTVSEQVTTCKGQVRYGIRQTKLIGDFLVKHQQTTSGRKKHIIIHLHNNAVGRKILAMEAALKCKCTGLSGSCTSKICWKKLPSMKRVAEKILQSYREAHKIDRQLMRRQVQKQLKRLGSYDHPRMVYIRKSPNYCQMSSRNHVLGSRGRPCEPSTCPTICCGGKVEQKENIVNKTCSCQLHWCCRIKCKVCSEVVKEYYCQ